MGDTDKTPDGGYSAGFLSGAANVRKVAAYTYQALLQMAATKLGVPASALTVTDGMVSGGGKSIAYGQLVQGQQLDLKIPVTGTPIKFAPPGSDSVAGLDWAGMDGLVVTGDPPLKPVSEYKVIGTSLSHARHSRQSHRADTMELRCNPAGNAACAHGATAGAGLDPDLTG